MSEKVEHKGWQAHASEAAEFYSKRAVKLCPLQIRTYTIS